MPENTCGHIERPHKARGLCKRCYDQWLLTRPGYAEKRKSQKRRWNESNPGGFRRRLYGFGHEEFVKKAAEQSGACAICLKAPEKSLCIDHDHKNGRIRGLLCNRCNFALGLLDDSPETLRNAIAYLEGLEGVKIQTSIINATNKCIPQLSAASPFCQQKES